MDEVEGTQQPCSAGGSVDSDEIPNPEGNLPPSRVLLCGRLAADEECVEATAALAAEVCGAADATDAADAADDEAVAGLEELAAAAVGCGGGRPLHVVFDHFQGPVFEAAHRAKHRILGRTALLQLAAQGERLPNNARPLYTLAMRGAVICFTGFRKKEELTHLITLIHNMGGSIRKDMSARVTHLIAAAAGGEKYRYAVTFRVPIMSRTWVEACWEQRKEITTDATDEAIMTEHKLKVFAGARVVFIGFAEDERQHMADVLSKNGGEPTSLDDLTCTHVVMANGETYGRAHAPSRSSMDLLSPRSRTHTPTAKTNLYRRLSARLSAKKKTPERSEEDYSRFNLETMDADKYKSLTRGLDYSTETSPATDESCSEKENVDEPKKGLLRKTSTLRSAEETIPETNEDDADILKSPHLSVLFEPEPEITLDLPTVTNSAVLSSGKKRSRNSTDSTAKQTEESDWKSPFKKLKIKDSFRFKGISKPVIFKRDKKKPRKSKSPLRSELDACLTSTPSPKKDDDADSICDRSVFTSSGIFDISFRSLRGTKSASRIRRSMKSLTASFRKRGEKPDAEISPVSSNEDCEEAATSALEATTPLRKAALDFCAQQRSKEALFKTPQSRKVATPTVSSPTLDPEAPAVAPHFPRREPTDETDSATALLPRHNRQFLSVVDEHNTTAMPDSVSPKAHIVKAEWFWASVQNEEAQEEKDYLFEDYLDSLIPVSRRSSAGSLSSAGERERERESSPPRSPGATSSSVVTPLSAAQLQLNRLRKRKLRGGDSALNKRRSSVGDAVLLSLSGGLLDSTQSPDGKQLLDEAECGVPVDVVRKLMSPRQQVFMELLQTESNYVNILHTIVTMFKLPLEQMTEEENGNSKPLLNNTELKIIFGNLPPIYEIHRRMLEELKWSSQNWSEDISIGRLVLKYAQDMVKAYPPFVNFFENTKEMLGQCDKDKPRFHAFLKICQTKPECGRQSLQELLIRPVQRLPSISLLLDDILKHTHKSNPDHVALVSALAGVREVMTHINEDKRKTEGQLQMFDIYNEIDNCPAHLVSSHRSFIARCEVVELSKDLSGRGDHLVLFLFSDTLEVCKRRSKSFNSKSPTGANGIHHTTSRFGSNKPYRHVQLMPLSTVKMVIDIRETDECHNVFALMCRSNQELKEKLYSFTITDELVEKTHFLRQLCRQMANTVCKADADKFLTSFESHQLDIDTSDIALGTLSKAFKFASRTRLKLESMAAIPWFRSAGDATTATSPSGTSQALGPTHLLESWVLRARLVLQVGRAFSFNKTPSKLKRAVSSMISPFGSAANLTPANQLAQMRLQSCTNINELGVSGMGNSGGNNAIEKAEVLVAPLSVQPQRKAKTASLSGGALRRL